LAVLEIGLDTIRKECPHFRAWITRLEKLGIGKKLTCFVEKMA